MPKYGKTVQESLKPGETMADYRERIKKDYNMTESREEHDVVGAMKKISYNGHSNRSLHEGIGMGWDRYPTQLSLFRVWLMGTKDIPVEEAFTFHTDDPRFDGYIAEYSKWMFDNRVKKVVGLPDPSEKEIEEHAVNLYSMLKTATDKMKNMKLPDIDYTDIRQVEKHKDFLLNFSGMGVDFGQEVASLTKNLKNSGKYIKKVFGNKFAYGDMMDSWEGMAGLGRMFSASYDAGRFEETHDAERKEMSEIAIKRFHLKTLKDKIKGKTIGEYVEDKKKDIIYDFTFEKIINDTAKIFSKEPIEDEIVDDYLAGRNNNFEEVYKKHLPKLRKDALLDNNHLCTELADNFSISLTIGGDATKEISEVFAGEPSPEELLDRLKNTKSGKKIGERLNYSFYKLEDSSYGSSKFYSAAGITGLDRFRIDGKSPQELWGDKYSSIKNPDDRDMLIKTELLKELYLGNSKIVAENYVITDDNKIIKSGATELTYSQKEVEGYLSYMAEVDALHENFVKVKDMFAKYQKDPEANFGGDKSEGSKYYRKMINALNKCLDATDLTTDSTKEDIFKAIQAYQKAAAEYYEERKGVITGPLTSKGVVRLKLAEDAKDNLMERYDRLNILSKGLELDVGKYDRDAVYSLRNLRYKIARAEENRGRKINIKDFTIESVKTKPCYENNIAAAKKAAKRNKKYTENPVYQQVMAAYPKNYMKMWCKALDGAEEINKERSSIKSAGDAHLPRNSKQSIVRSSNASASSTKPSTRSLK